ncbi:endonuclease/exonuclease/phosphatase family protein [Candidatus Enterococcus ferrettii]|uniref:Maltose 6'-phosphate phosphatase n=1 Tax=Candidatus Enterococcus ferrettii TaxID=2815324 RepID=A0ABV0EK38_9ENTE|nr:endonuclease/exonuclease/phosphatase family protein [Enterococcus sp. 665A]MBO1338300.1 endonuclease/exonuclease/phosphatase family protein [Enterococcus sp. 665A]
MKLLTLNTHSWVESDQIAKLHQLAEAIVKEKFDVIALQEVNQFRGSQSVEDSQVCSLSKVPIKEDNFAHLLLKILANKGIEYFGIWGDCHVGFDIYEEGTALLSRVPFQETKKITFRSELDFEDVRRRTVVGASVELEGELQWFYSAHFSWWEFEGETLFTEEWQTFEQAIQPCLKQPTYLLGDFNNDAQQAAEGYQLIQAQQQWQDSFHAAQEKTGEHTVTKKIAGWDENQEKLRIDYVFTSRKLPVASYQTIFDNKNYPMISDHCGIAVEIKPEAKGSCAYAS